jgi:TolB-like protein
MSADPEQEYFGDGIAEEILNGLAQIQDLQVAARTSSFYFKGERVNLKTIAETINANHVLEGSVRKSGNRLRITAQLIKIEEGFHLWPETYNRDTSDIFAVQEEIARTVVEKLQLKLGLAKNEKLVKQGTDNAEAYNCLLRFGSV